MKSLKRSKVTTVRRKTRPARHRRRETGVVAESPDLEIANGSFRRKPRQCRFHFEERREGLAAAR
jgi:hypothetical protein